MNDRIRVLLADDHAVVRKGIREFLEEAGDIQAGADGYVLRPPAAMRRCAPGAAPG